MKEEKPYDSSGDTLQHIIRVNNHIAAFIFRFIDRARQHDKSKMQPPEKEIFDEFTPKLNGVEYNSPEYKEFLREMGIALAHHYKHNSHHPEHYPNGVHGMSLLDIVEMFCDWKAATERMKGGSLETSIQKNKIRFNMSEQLAEILENTRKELNW